MIAAPDIFSPEHHATAAGVVQYQSDTKSCHPREEALFQERIETARSIKEQSVIIRCLYTSTIVLDF